MSAYRVEVAQDDTLERRSRMDRIPDNLLVDLLRVSIRRHSGFDRGILGYRQVLRIRLSVYRTRGREYDTFDIEFRHHLQQVHQSDNIIAIILQRLLYGFSYRLASGEQDNAFDARMSFQCLASTFLIL